MEIALAVVDDHPAITLAIDAAIQAQHSRGQETPIRLVGSARTVVAAVALLRGVDRPDVILCDIQLDAGIDGLDVVDAAKRQAFGSSS